MSKKSDKSVQMGKTKKTTDSIINDAIARQNSWMERRRDFAKRFLKKLNIFARPAPKMDADGKPIVASANCKSEKKSGLASYWFPMLCIFLVACIIMWVVFSGNNSSGTIAAPVVPEPIVQVIEEKEEVSIPTFDIVRIEKEGNIVIAGRWLPNKNISVMVNKKVIATELTNASGEFAYAPTRAWKPGNYTIALIGTDPETKSENNVFVYVSGHGYENSVSLLMTKDGSTLLQSPKLRDGDLAVSKIDYMENGRIVVTGDALPRLRVSLTLNDKYLGFARVSDHKHFGLGADVEKLESGKEYSLTVRLHDGDGKTVSSVTHKFVMPTATGDDDTFYTVRRGDSLWIIARNFMRRGILFSIIAQKNEIENPNLIYPKQVLKIPVLGK